MRSDILIRFGKTRGNPEHYFRVQLSWDGGQSFGDALVMKKDDRDGPDRNSTPYKVEWAATKELERKAEAALGRLEKRFSARDTRSELKKFLKGVPRHYVPPDAEIPVDLGVRIANSRVGLGVYAGTEPNAWEQEADADARRRARIADRPGDEGGVQMTELFQWVPWFGELAKKVREGRREGLVERARKVDWAGGRCAVLAQGEQNADPLTFFYHLAAVAGGKAEKREKVYSSVAEVFEIESNLDYSFEDRFIFPIPPGFAVLFNNTGADPRLFWEMFDQACAVDGTSYGSVSADTFGKVLQVKGVGVPKLTQVLFLINPKAFLPFDLAAVLPLEVGRFKKPPAKMSWAEYVDEMGRIRTAFPGCQCYELNAIGYLWTSGHLPRKGNRWYQIGTGEDGWRDFRDNHWVHQGGLGDMHRPAKGAVLPDSKQGYQLDAPEPGDVLLVRSGTQKGRGIGIVYRNDHGERSHQNPRIHVLWVNKKQAALAANLPAVGFSEAGRTTYEAFAKCAAYWATLDLLHPPKSGTGESRPEGENINTLIQSLQDDGLLFSQELVASYILALQTKRFAILTGISGTGKTQIAKAVAQHFELRRPVARIPDDAVIREVKPAFVKFAKFVLPVAISNELNIETKPNPGTGPTLGVRYPGGHARLRTFLAAGKNPILHFKGDSRKWLQSTFEVGDQFWLRVQPSETDGPGELEIGLPDTDVVEQHIHNYVVIPVRPDWVDNRGLLGYLNPLTNEYSTTPFLNLLLRAHDEEKRAEAAGEKPHPFFVILDEMNLARVEHYFSDFLSALESGEDIPLHEDEAIDSGESQSGPRVPRQLKVPGNVLFTGTVNVDETTYMFSPKVLDRAFTIEFDQVDLKGFSKDISSEDTSGLNLDGVQDSLDLLPSGRSDDDWKPSREDWVEFSKKTPGHHKALLKLHNILERQHRHFGYRVANEIARFVNLAREQAAEADTDPAVDAAFDLALLQKVLPKFHGTQQELESLLREIFQFAVHGGGHAPKKNQTVELDDWKVVKGRLVTKSKAQAPSQTPSGDADAEGDEADSDNAEAADAGTKSAAYPRTGAKVLRMLNRLRDRGFTSFIE